MSSAPPKIIFANQLRGLAAMFVAGSHLVGVYWAMRDVVGATTATPVQDGTAPAILTLFNQQWLNFGPLGVGVFFLISGLVIPFSLEHHTRGSFVLARVLRIYPTYLVALVLEMAVLHADAVYWGRPFPYGHWTIISNALLIYDTVGQPSVDLVNWTLCVELKFYVLMMLLAPRILRGAVGGVLLVGATVVALNFGLKWHPFAEGSRLLALTDQFSIESTFIVFMLIGVLFNFHIRGLLRLPAFIASCVVMTGLFLTSWAQSAISDQLPVVAANYLYALGLFGLLYFLRRYARPIRVLDFLASISFPFYLVHSLIGYAILKFLILHLGLGYPIAFCITLGSGIGIATALHFSVETKSIRMGRLLGHHRASRSAASLSRHRTSAA